MARITPETLRKLRNHRGWTLDQLAEKANLDRQTIFRLESGRREQTRDTTIEKLAKALGTERDVLTKAVPPDDQEPVAAWEPGKSQLNLRISGQARNALLLVSDRYHVRPAQVVELAPLLFNWAADKCLRQREERLDELRRRQSEIAQEMEEFASEFSQLIGGPPPPIAFESFEFNDEMEQYLTNAEWAIQFHDLFHEDEYGELGELVPIANFLAGLASELGDQAEFHGWDSDSSPNYTVCKDEATWLANGDEEALESILLGYAPLHELPKEDWKDLRDALFSEGAPEIRFLKDADESRAMVESDQRRAAERVEWLRAHGKPTADESSGSAS